MRKSIPPNYDKILEEYIQLNWRHDRALHHLAGIKPMTEDIREAIAILEGEEDV